MSKKERLTPQDLDARLKFILGITLGTILLATSLGILYALIFVTQPIGAQSENDKMFFTPGVANTTLTSLVFLKTGHRNIDESNIE